MNKAGLWMVYDNEAGLVCTGNYDVCNSIYEKHVKEVMDYVQREGEFSLGLDDTVILARVEKMIYPDEVEEGVYDWKEENDVFTAEGDQSTE
ncbi:hypothetical protein MKZ12_07165 [Paenibacillus sp. FSL R5-0713]|uniref:hypothetical protein n=1 Tax=Paenibacillus sp. FSL R5-0713 TaxID=2921655 RepID=UPI0030D9F7E9